MRINILPLLITLVVFSCKDADETPEKSTSIHLIAYETGTSSYKYLVNGKEQEVPNKLNSEYTTLVSVNVDKEGNSYFYYIDKSPGTPSKLYYYTNGIERLVTEFPYPNVFFTHNYSNKDESILVSGYVEGQKGFYIEGADITYVGEAEHSMIHTAYKDNDGRYHLIYQERETTYSDIYDSNFSYAVGPIKYIIDNNASIIETPEASIVNDISFYSKNGAPNLRLDLELNATSPDFVQGIFDFNGSELIEVKLPFSSDGRINIHKHTFINETEYLLGRFTSPDEDNYSFYLENGVLHKFIDQQGPTIFRDVVRVDNDTHIIGASSSIQDYTDVESLYLVNGEPNEFSDIQNLVLLAIFKVE